MVSSITDPDGLYGHPVTYTLWELSNGRLLATALEGRRGSERRCSHAIGFSLNNEEDSE